MGSGACMVTHASWAEEPVDAMSGEIKNGASWEMESKLALIEIIRR